MAMTAPTEDAVSAAFFDILFPLWFNLNIEPKVHYITILNYIFLTFNPQFSSGL